MAKPTMTKTGEIVKPAPITGTGLTQVQTWLTKMQPEIVRALPRHVTPERMMRVIQSALSREPKLAVCTQVSLLGSLMTCGQMGLEPNTPLGHAYLIPFRNHKNNTTECQIIIGYQGYMDLVRRSGEIARIRADVVREGDKFEYKKGTSQFVNHVESTDQDRETKKITHAYAVAVYKDGGEAFEILSLAKIISYRNRSKAKDSGPWVTDFEAMCKKTAVRRLITWLPKTIEMASAVALDEAPEHGKSQAYYWDEVVTEVMKKEGLDVKAEVVDEETGEVFPAQNAPEAVPQAPGSTETPKKDESIILSPGQNLDDESDEIKW